ncbi:hypothetical protein ACJX0J_029583, partial [Zea mays]
LLDALAFWAWADYNYLIQKDIRVRHPVGTVTRRASIVEKVTSKRVHIMTDGKLNMLLLGSFRSANNFEVVKKLFFKKMVRETKIALLKNTILELLDFSAHA